jgi:hypothetical protein
MNTGVDMGRRPPATLAGPAVALRHELAALALADERRRALGMFLRHLERGERIAQRIAGRQVALAPDTRAARFFRSQARQEGLHARVFDTAARWLHAAPGELPRDPYDAYEQHLQRAADRGDYAETVVGTQIVLEALGEVLLARLEGGLARHGAGFGMLRRMMLAQEAAHHAFGQAAVASMLGAGTLTVPVIDAHTAGYRRLAQPMIAAAAPVLRHFVLSVDDIAGDLDARLRNVGFA